MLRTIIACLALIAGALTVNPATLQADDARSLDEQLLDEFDSDPIEDPVDPIDDPADRTAEPGAKGSKSDAKNPLLDVARRMREVEDRIGRADIGPGTRDLQKSIVDDLDRMLQQARKACKQGKPGKNQPQDTTNRKPIGSPGVKPAGGNKPNDKPAVESSQRPKGNGETRHADAEEMGDVLKKLWGELPKRQREQMSQWQLEEFLPKYELLIEEYFRRLSRGNKER
jgi:predicted RNA-binding Zn ribbon-like protein